MDIIFDVDGTLANCEHRRHWVECVGKKNWHAFNMEADMDKPIEPVAVLARSLGVLAHRIIISTGRTENLRPLTERWLAHHQISYTKLYMRQDNDFRDDAVVKEEMLDRMIDEGFRPEVAFDDRVKVINMWKSRKIMVMAINGGAEF